VKTTIYPIKRYISIVAVCILLAFAGGTSMAVTVVLGPGGLTNLVVNVPTNEMMIVRAASLDGQSDVSITSGGVVYASGRFTSAAHTNRTAQCRTARRENSFSKVVQMAQTLSRPLVTPFTRYAAHQTTSSYCKFVALASSRAALSAR
jgi:hypothetical protein